MLACPLAGLFLLLTLMLGAWAYRKDKADACKEEEEAEQEVRGQ